MILEAIVNVLTGNTEAARYRRYEARREERERHKARYEASHKERVEGTTHTDVRVRRDGRVTDGRGHEYVESSVRDDGFYHAVTEASARSGFYRLHREHGRLVCDGGGLEFQHVGDGKYTRLTPRKLK
jgi:hypothetical protein